MNAAPSRSDPAGAAYLDLRRIARDTGRPTDELHQLYALEGFLDRLAISPHRQLLILKGGVLLSVFDSRRPTRDLDLAAIDNVGTAALRGTVNEILVIERSDGLVFDPTATTAGTIRSNELYPSTRAKIVATLATARIGFHVDINVGDPLSPPPRPVDVPRLLGGEPISVIGYRIELVLAEKIVTAIQRGTANTRWRDFVDIASLARSEHDVAALRSSIAAVASHRGVRLLPLREALAGFADLAQPRWAAWRRRQRLTKLPATFADLLDEVIAFAEPLLDAEHSQS